MQILYAGQSVLNPDGGGEISAYLLLKKLAEKHKIIVFGIGARDKKEFSKNNIKFYEYSIPAYIKRKFSPSNFLLENYFKKKITEKINLIKPNLIFLQNPGYVNFKDIFQKTKTIVFIRSLDWYGIKNQDAGLIKKIFGFPFFVVRHNRAKIFLKNADLVFTNSYFIQRKLKELINISSQVIYPFIDKEEYKTDIDPKKQDYITFVNLNFQKGGKVALKIVERLPNRKFLFITGNIIGKNKNKYLLSKMKKLKNIKSIKWAENMKEIYKVSRLFLVPSVWDEPFCRLPIEAGINGIPTIASNKGGLPESVGDAGLLIKNVNNINEWIEKIKKLDDQNEYKNFSLKAIINAQKFDFNIILSEFKKIINEQLQIDL